MKTNPTGIPDIRPTLRILGIRGVPARHGGFESFAEHLSQYLVERGWKVVVYCQSADVRTIVEDEWRGVHRVHVPAPDTNFGSVKFDWHSIEHASRHRDLCLTLGYDTAAFCLRLRLAGVPNVINMDGIEWARAKWGPVLKLWYYLNDWAGSWLGNALVADHPEIGELLARRGVRSKITVIPYGSHEVLEADPAPLDSLGIRPGEFLVVIARPEPENSIVEIVEAHRLAGLPHRLVLLGKYVDTNPYHRKVKSLAHPGVMFPGAIHEARTIHALRLHATAYLHGHQVGGTNPSLVEALGAGSPVIAHDNRFNRWVAGPDALYFSTPARAAECMRAVVYDPQMRERMRASSRRRWAEAFTLPSIHRQYEQLLSRFAPRAPGGGDMDTRG